MKPKEEGKPQLCPDCHGVWGADSRGQLYPYCRHCRADRSLFLAEHMKAANDTLGAYSFCESIFAGPLAPWHIRKMTSAGKFLGGGIDTEGLCGFPKKRAGWDLEVGLTKHHLNNNTCKRCLERYREETS